MQKTAVHGFLTTGFVGTNGLLRVAQYCVPSTLAQGVSKGSQWDTFGISGLSVDIQIIRVSMSGGWVDADGIVGLQDQTVQVCLRLTCAEFAPTDVDVGVLGFEQMQVVGDVAIFQVRTLSSGMASYCLKYIMDTWNFNPCQNTSIWDQGLYYIMIVLSNTGEVLLLPYDDVPMQICQWNMVDKSTTSCTKYQGFDWRSVPAKAKGIQSRVSQFMSINYNIFIALNQPSKWLKMLSVSTQSDYASSMVGNSMPVSMTYTLQQQCNLNSCNGCLQLAVQRLCFTAQQCQVARCIGSQVNQLRPLCAIGGAVESQLFTFLASMHGIWSMISSTLTSILEISGGINPPRTIAWPDQAFYGIVCSQKDIIALVVSILTAAINGVVQASMPVIMMAHGEAVDNSFLATFTLTMMAVTDFLFQICLAPLYAAIAAQKVVVCQANSLVAAIAGNNHDAVTIGDPGIQATASSSTGVCMSQVHTENAQGLNSGTNNSKAFASGSTQILSTLGGLALQLPLDALIHPIDVFFKWLLGCLVGLQDVFETADQKK